MLTVKITQPNPKYILLVILIAIGCSYVNTIYSPFVLDDFHSFIDEPSVYLRGFSLKEVEGLGGSAFGIKRLIPMLSFAIDHKLFSIHNSISQYHITNILIHIINTVLFYILIRAILRSQEENKLCKSISVNAFALSVVALWALNPLQTNAVTYIVQRMASLVTLFYLLSIIMYIKIREEGICLNKKYCFLLFLSIFFAALSKENFATIPFTIIALEVFFFRRNNWGRITKKNAILFSVPIILILYLISPVIIEKYRELISGYNYRYFTLSERLLTEPRVVLHYISLFLFPLPGRLNLEYDFPLSSSLVSPPTTIASILLIVALVFFSIKKRREYPLIGFGILWYFITISIESSFIPLEIAFEHRAYLPTIGVSITIVGLLDVFFYKIKLFLKDDLHPLLFPLIIIIFCSILSVLTTMRNYTWRDSLSIYKDCAIKSPEKPRVLLNYANALTSNNRHVEARKLYDKIILMTKPYKEEYLRATCNTLNTYDDLEELESGVELAIKRLKEMPPYANASDMNIFFHGMAIAHIRLKRYKLAKEFLISSIMNTSTEIDPMLIQRLEMTEKILDEGKTKSYINYKMADIFINLERYDLAAKYIKPLEQTGEYPEIIEKYINAKKLN